MPASQPPAPSRIVGTSRPVLFPYGQPVADKHRAHCEGLLIRNGGDQQRFIDAPSDSLGQFSRYVARIPAVLAERPMVVLTRTNPLALTTLQARRELERAIPQLSGATWLIYLSPELDPFFLGTAQAIGELTLPLHRAPVWNAPGGMRFIVLSSCVHDADSVRNRLLEVHRGAVEPSRVSQVRARARVGRTLPPPARHRTMPYGLRANPAG